MKTYHPQHIFLFTLDSHALLVANFSLTEPSPPNFSYPSLGKKEGPVVPVAWEPLLYSIMGVADIENMSNGGEKR